MLVLGEPAADLAGDIVADLTGVLGETADVPATAGDVADLTFAEFSAGEGNSGVCGYGLSPVGGAGVGGRDADSSSVVSASSTNTAAGLNTGLGVACRGRELSGRNNTELGVVCRGREVGGTTQDWGLSTEGGKNNTGLGVVCRGREVGGTTQDWGLSAEGGKWGEQHRTGGCL